VCLYFLHSVTRETDGRQADRIYHGATRAALAKGVARWASLACVEPSYRFDRRSDDILQHVRRRFLLNTRGTPCHEISCQSRFSKGVSNRAKVKIIYQKFLVNFTRSTFSSARYRACSWGFAGWQLRTSVERASLSQQSPNRRLLSRFRLVTLRSSVSASLSLQRRSRIV